MLGAVGSGSCRVHSAEDSPGGILEGFGNFFIDLHDFGVSPGTRHQSHEKFLIHRGDVITKFSFACGMFQTRQVHDGASNWILERLLRIHTLQRETRIALEAGNPQKWPGRAATLLTQDWDIRSSPLGSEHWSASDGRVTV